RRPLAAARAVIFAQMVDDPSTYVDELLADPEIGKKAEAELERRLEIWRKQVAAYDDAERLGDSSVPEPGPEPTLEECAAEIERERLFRLIEELVKWENTTNEEVLERAREEIRKSWRRTCEANKDHPRAAELFDPEKLPAFHDPFAGGGALPLEAQRLGLEAYASDLNPVAVLINKAMIEIPPKFAGMPPVNPEARGDRALFEREWKGAQGLAEDVRYYGRWMRDEAEKRIGHLYPKVKITPELVRERPDLEKYEGRELTVIAWLWARTIKSPNPAFAHLDVPLASTFMLSTKKGKEAYVEPIVEGDSYRFTVKVGKPEDPERAKTGTKLSRGSFRCLFSDVPIPYEYIDSEANAGRMGARLMAIVAEGDRERIYLPPSAEAEAVARSAKPTWKPDLPSRGTWASNAQGRRYGFWTFGDYFTDRQLVALTTFSELVQEARERVKRDAIAAGLADDGRGLEAGGTGAEGYAEGVGVYLGFAVDKGANYWSSLCSWHSGRDTVTSTFGRQAIPMVWDFADANPLSDSSGNFLAGINQSAKFIETAPASPAGHVRQADAMVQTISTSKTVSTDPPYYDNIGYADLSDFFYVWIRHSMRQVFPDLFATVAVPKAEELVATPYRHGGQKEAEEFFLEGMSNAMKRLSNQAQAATPVTIYYAFKQSETTSNGDRSSTGWETFLDAVIKSDLAISGTWPIRTEYTGNLKKNVSALASSIVLVCRPRPKDAPIATRQEFLRQLKAELPVALRHLQRGNIAPVDLAQAAIGPGMAVYTRYSKVIDAAGEPLTVREALALINQTLDEVLAEQEGDFDADTRWALAWFEQYGFEEGEFGQADVLARAKNTSVSGMVEAGIVDSRAGKVRLLEPTELEADWDPSTDSRLTVWETTHQLVRALEASGEAGAAELAAGLGARAEIARELAYRLYTVCERKRWAQEALAYNGLVQSWPEVVRLAGEVGAQSRGATEQTALF
ncbi:MAG TPA: DUF1156 domain-containing protein, partial [Longimicrobiales bacterium]|nr:DUF1156 domain-containing protein [Longimicrobiales bacterium]